MEQKTTGRYDVPIMFLFSFSLRSKWCYVHSKRTVPGEMLWLLREGPSAISISSLQVGKHEPWTMPWALRITRSSFQNLNCGRCCGFVDLMFEASDWRPDSSTQGKDSHQCMLKRSWIYWIDKHVKPWCYPNESFSWIILSHNAGRVHHCSRLKDVFRWLNLESSSLVVV